MSLGIFLGALGKAFNLQGLSDCLTREKPPQPQPYVLGKDRIMAGLSGATWFKASDEIERGRFSECLAQMLGRQKGETITRDDAENAIALSMAFTLREEGRGVGSAAELLPEARMTLNEILDCTQPLAEVAPPALQA